MRLLGATNVLMVLLASTAWGEATDADKGAESAKTYFDEKIAPYAGGRQTVRDNLINPMIAGGTLTTLDGQTSFNATSFKSSNTPLIKVTVDPYHPTGDIQRILVEQDLTADGSFDTAAVFPIPSEASGQMISAVCANGYVQCSPGTYTNCRFREWAADSAGLISSVVAGGGDGPNDGSIGTLSSCYCFSKACSKNNNAILNIDSITANVGGGLLATYIGAKTGMMITGAQSTGTGQIVYSGVSSESVPTGMKANMTAEELAAMPVISSIDTAQAQSYYNQPDALADLTESARQQQVGTPNSLFNAFAGVALKQVGTTVSCTNLVTPSLSVLTRTESKMSDVVITTCVDVRSYAVVNKIGENKYAVGISVADCSYPYIADLGSYGVLSTYYSLSQPSSTIGFEIASVKATAKLWGNKCSAGEGTATWTPAVGLNSPVKAITSSVCSGTPGSGDQYPNYTWNIDVTYNSQELSTVTNLGCQILEQDTNCKVQQELWDGRPVVVNGLNTGFQLGQVCKDVAGPLRNANICTPPDRSWFRQDKTFYCKNTNPGYDLSAIQQRAKEIQDSTNMPTGDTMNYTDGGVSYSFNVPKRGPAADCSQVCRTKIPTNETPMTANGTPSSSTLTGKGLTDQSWTFFYKDCDGRPDGSWQCPIDAASGEQVVTGCGCSSDMGTVLGALTAANEAAQDSICSKD